MRPEALATPGQYGGRLHLARTVALALSASELYFSASAKTTLAQFFTAVADRITNGGSSKPETLPSPGKLAMGIHLRMESARAVAYALQRASAPNRAALATFFTAAATAVGAGLPAYLGVVSSGTHVPNYVSTTNKFIGVTSEHTMIQAVTSFRLVYANWRVAAGEIDGVAATASVGIEYPAGVFTRVLFSGVTPGVLAAGSTTESDPIALSIPAGAKYKVHAKLGWASGFFIACDNMSYHASMRFSEGAATGDVPDYSLGGGQWAAPAVNTATYAHPPIAIVATTTKPTVALFGSSTPRGFGDLTITDYGVMGYLQRAFSPTAAVMDLAVSGDSFTNSASSRTKRLALLKYTSHVVASIGTNDIYGAPAWTAAQTITAYNALITSIGPTKKIWLALYQPRNTGSWAFYGTQVVNATLEAHRVNVNNAVKGGLVGVTGVIDGLSASENNVNPEDGRWRFDLGVSTTDGIHMNTPTYIRAAALVPVSSVLAS